MRYDSLSMDLFLRDGQGGVVRIDCSQACPRMSSREMVEYLASRFGQEVVWPGEVKVVDSSSEEKPAAEADQVEATGGGVSQGVESTGTDESSEESEDGVGQEAIATSAQKAEKRIELDRPPDEMYAGLTCSLSGGD